MTAAAAVVAARNARFVERLRPAQLIRLEDFDWGRTRAPAVAREHPEFIEAVHFVMVVESATDSYAATLLAASARGAPWLGLFIDRIWVPEEHTHHLPYKRYLMEAGWSEAQLDRDIEDARAADFTHGAGYSPLMGATFGEVQEYLTALYYQVMEAYIEPHDPVFAEAVRAVKIQERFHRSVYGRLARNSLQPYAEQARAGSRADRRAYQAAAAEVIDALADFRMPGHIVTPREQERSGELATQMGLNLRQLKRELVEIPLEMVGHDGLGRVALRYVVVQAEAAWARFALTAIERILDVTHLYGMVGGAIAQDLMDVEEPQGLNPLRPLIRRLMPA